MPKSRLAIAVLLIALEGCAGAVSVKVPASAVAKATSGIRAPEAKAGTEAKPADPKLAASTALKVSLHVPDDIGVKLPASLLDKRASNVISNDGGSVISNDGGSVVSNDGGSVISNDGGSVISNDGGSVVAKGGAHAFGLLDVDPVIHNSQKPSEQVAEFFHMMTGSYATTVHATNGLLALIKEPSNLDELLAGKPLVLPFPDLEHGTVIPIKIELKLVAGQDPLLTITLQRDVPVKVLELSFKDKDHGTAVVHLVSGAPGGDHDLMFRTTFDRVKNRAEIDSYAGHFDEYGKVRVHISIARPEHLVADGPSLQIRVATAERGSIAPALPNGQVVATAYALRDGSVSAISGLHAFESTTPDITFKANTEAPADLRQSFFMAPTGAPTAATPALKAIVPPLTDIYSPLMPDPDASDLSADPLFQFSK